MTVDPDVTEPRELWPSLHFLCYKFLHAFLVGSISRQFVCLQLKFKMRCLKLECDARVQWQLGHQKTGPKGVQMKTQHVENGESSLHDVALSEDKDLTCNLNGRKRGKKLGRNLLKEMIAVCILNGQKTLKSIKRKRKKISANHKNRYI